MSEWQELTLEQVSESIDYGLTASAEDIPTGLRFLRITDMASRNLNWGQVPWVTVSTQDQEKYRLHDNDIVIARTGATTGESYYIKNPPNAVFASYLVRYKIKPEFNARYVSYFLRSKNWWDYVKGVLGDKSAQPNASASTMAKVKLPIPPKLEQDAIAAILGALDDKIELNRRMNATLESMARALFKSWFVDFDPVRARIEDKRLFGMDAATAALFPSRLVASEAEKIPEGWITTELSNVCSELRRGISPKYLKEGGIRVLNQKCIRNQIVGFDEARRHDNFQKPIIGRELNKGDILINSTGVGTLGRVAQIWLLEETTIVDSHVTVVRANPSKVLPIYLGMNLLARQQEIELLGEGSTGQTELSRAHLGKLEILIPNIQIQQAFDILINPLIEKSVALQKEIFKLSKTRDYLLPKLISGDVRVHAGAEVIDLVAILKERAETSIIEKGYVDAKEMCRQQGVAIVKNQNLSKGRINHDDSNDEFYIEVANTDDSFTIMHELVHHAKHSDRIKQCAVGRKDEYSLSEKEEDDVDALAAEILMPEKFVREFLEQKDIQNEGFVEDKIIKSCAKQFHVNEPAMRRRLNNLGYKTNYKNYRNDSV